MQRLRFYSGIIILFLVVGIAGPVLGASIIVSPSGDNAFAVQGSALSGVAGMDITVIYDAGTMRNVKVAPGALIGSSMFVPNTSTPGMLRFAVLNTSGNISGSGIIAAISFEKAGSSPGLITRITASLINAIGAPLAATASFINPSESKSPPTDTTAAASTASPFSANPTPTAAGQTGTTGVAGSAPGMTVSMPAETSDRAGDKKLDSQMPVEPSQMPPPSTDVAVQDSPREREERKVPEKKYLAFQTVAEKFRSFSGTPSIESLSALFVPDKGLLYRQEPPIVLSNGKDTLKVIVHLEDSVRSAPNFAFENAKMLSLKKGEPGEWIIEALPKKDAQDAQLNLFFDETTINIPLTIAPPLSEQQLGVLKGLTDNDFKQFIKERGTKAAPRFDLNRDGKRDYLDDYLFTANYLATRKKAPLPGKGSKK